VIAVLLPAPSVLRFEWVAGVVVVALIVGPVIGVIVSRWPNAMRWVLASMLAVGAAALYTVIYVPYCDGIFYYLNSLCWGS
jgi:hypothetical protein